VLLLVVVYFGGAKASRYQIRDTTGEKETTDDTNKKAFGSVQQLHNQRIIGSDPIIFCAEIINPSRGPRSSLVARSTPYGILALVGTLYWRPSFHPLSLFLLLL
jgi:hypothetical protein